ncbi:MAG: radical SAM protein [Methanoregula sp.]
MKIVFYSPGKSFSQNLGVGYLVSYLRQKKVECNIEYIDNISDPNLGFSKIIKSNPSIVAISSTSRDFYHLYDLSTLIKDYNENIIILLGGAHITACPNTLPPSVDLGFIGESELSFYEVIRLIADKKFNVHEISNIKGLVFHRKNNELILTEPNELIMDIDQLPAPARDIYPGNNLCQKEVAQLITSRGCPYHCSYCQATRLHRKYRFHSAEYLLNEIKQLYLKYRKTLFQINDDLFIVNRKRLQRLIDLLEQEKLLGKIQFVANGRANLIDDDLIVLLKRLNVIHIGMGLESMSQKMLPLLKDGVTVEDNKNAVELLHKNGIGIGAYFIIGSPSETIEDIEETYQYLRVNRNKFQAVVVSISTPLPMTPLWDVCVEENKINPDYCVFNYDEVQMASHECDKNIYVGDIPYADFVKIYQIFFELSQNPNASVPQSLKILPDQIKKNFITPFDAIEQVRGNYASEKWPANVNIFWTCSITPLEAYLRTIGGENRIKISFFSGLIHNKIKIVLENVEDNKVLLTRTIYCKKELWIEKEFSIKKINPSSILKLTIHTNGICLNDYGISEERRNLGIAIKEIRLISKENAGIIGI